MTFELNQRLANDSRLIIEWPLSQVRVMNDSHYPWFVLIPMRDGVKEIIDLNEQDQWQLWQESARLSQWIKQEYQPDKLNVAVLGNVVSQLHMHHVARYTSDSAWPDPIWGKHPMQPLSEERLAQIMASSLTKLSWPRQA